MYVCMVYFYRYKVLLSRLKNQWFLNFNSDTTKRTEDLEILESWSWHIPLPIQLTWLRRKGLVKASWNETNDFIRRQEVCPLNHFLLVLHLSTTDIPIPMQFWWFWNLTYSLGVSKFYYSQWKTHFFPSQW